MKKKNISEYPCPLLIHTQYNNLEKTKMWTHEVKTKSDTDVKLEIGRFLYDIGFSQACIAHILLSLEEGRTLGSAMSEVLTLKE